MRSTDRKTDNRKYRAVLMDDAGENVLNAIAVKGSDNLPPGYEFIGEEIVNKGDKRDKDKKFTRVQRTLTNKQKIDELEASVTKRNLRSAALGDQEAINILRKVEDQIAALGVRAIK